MKKIYPTKERLEQLFSLDPETGIFIRKTSLGNTKAGQFAGCNDGNGYLQIMVDWQKYRAHRLAYIMYYGKHEGHLQIDHINGIRSDNRRSNLRLVTNKQNNENKSKRADNKSGFIGVSFHKAAQKWIANIGHNGKQTYLGLFNTPKEASIAYQAEASKKFTHVEVTK